LSFPETVRACFLADGGYDIPEDLQYGERAVVASTIVNRRFPLVDLDRVLSEHVFNLL